MQLVKDLGCDVERKSRNPVQMGAEDRLAEIGAFLALGFRRLRLVRENELDAFPAAERLCGQAVDGDGALPAKEVA